MPVCVKMNTCSLFNYICNVNKTTPANNDKNYSINHLTSGKDWAGCSNFAATSAKVSSNQVATLPDSVATLHLTPAALIATTLSPARPRETAFGWCTFGS